VLRTHATKNREAERRIWAFPPQYSEPMKQAFQLRYALIPYIYTAARQAYDTGVSILRPMYYDSPEANESYTYTGQYMFGDSVLVAPIASALDPLYHLARKTVWFPEGEWIEWSTGEHIKGPVAIERNYPLDQIPLFLKAGAILPMQPKMNFSGERPVDPLILTVFPGGGSSTRLYEDAGDSLGYKNDEAAWTEIRTETPNATTFKLRVQPVEGSYPGMLTERGYEIRLFSTWPPDSVEFNGQNVPYTPDGAGSLGWRYDGDSLSTIIRLPKTSVNTGIELTVQISADKAAHAKLLNGAVGRMARAVRLFHDAENSGPDSLLRLATMSRRIELAPETAVQELEGYAAARQKVIDEFEKTNDRAWQLLGTQAISESMNKVEAEQ
jgi:alpha-glucosidase